MSYGKQATQQAKDLLTLCLAKAIHQSLCAQMGDDWFASFLRVDQAQDTKFQITRPGQTSVRDMDLQALLKILRYREYFSDAVFTYYGFLTGNDPYTDQTQKRQIRSLLDRLITEFRNQIDAHSRVADIEREMSKGKSNRLYSYREALMDMEKLSGIFACVCDNRDKSYHSQIAALSKTKRKPWWLFIPAAVIAMIVGTVLFIHFNNKPADPEPPSSGNVFYDTNNVAFVPDELSVAPVHIYFEGDALVAKCYILNGTADEISHIVVKSITVMDADTKEPIARAGFGVLEGLHLDANTYGEWTFRFPEETILSKDANLRDIQLEYQCR